MSRPVEVDLIGGPIMSGTNVPLSGQPCMTLISLLCLELQIKSNQAIQKNNNKTRQVKGIKMESC